MNLGRVSCFGAKCCRSWSRGALFCSRVASKNILISMSLCSKPEFIDLTHSSSPSSGEADLTLDFFPSSGDSTDAKGRTKHSSRAMDHKANATDGEDSLCGSKRRKLNSDSLAVTQTSKPSSNGSGSTSTTQDLPECIFAADCYRKNPKHFAKYSHPEKSSSFDFFSSGYTFFRNKLQVLERSNSDLNGTDHSPSLSFCDLFRGRNCSHALITTYNVDLEWMLELPVGWEKIKTTLVHDDRIPSSLQLPNNWTIRRAPLPIPFGTHHSKAFFLFFDDRLRIAISTANLLAMDYRRKDQGIWVQDFPLRSSEGTRSSTKKPAPLSSEWLAADFLSTLSDYLTRIGLDDWNFQLAKYDFSDVRVVLIPSVPGYHRGALRDRYGHMKLRWVLSKAHLPDPSALNWSVLCQFTSFGSIQENWLTNELLQSFLSSPATFSRLRESRPPEEQIKFIWPSVEFVRNSIDGYAAGGNSVTTMLPDSL